MKPHYEEPSVTLYHGDCLDVLRSFPDASVDSVTTDPPYGLAELPARVVAAAMAAWLSGDREHVPDGRGFMGRDWDRFVPPPAVWDECLRVLKPGGHLLAFAGSRTADLMGMSIRLAGFEIRDGIDWIYASGFPKSLDVSKAIDKAGGNALAWREFSTAYAAAIAASPLTHADVDRHLGIKASSCFWARTDHRGGMPPRHHWERLRDLLALPAEFERLYDEAEREVVGEGYRVRRESDVQIAGLSDGAYPLTAPATDGARRWAGWGTALKPAREPIVVARKPLAGTVAATVLAYGTGALNIDGCRVSGSDKDPNARKAKTRSGVEKFPNAYGDGLTADGSGWNGSAGRWPSNVVLSHAATADGLDLCADGCVPGCPVAELDAQSGNRPGMRPGVLRRGASTGRSIGGASAYGTAAPQAVQAGYDDDGGAARFFPVFRYEPKAPTAERPRDGQTAHPTVKPLDFMRWLVRLVTPPGGVVLDPFAGSGTTAEACVIEGFRCITVEREAAYLPLIVARLSKPIQPSLGFDVEAVAS